MTQKRPDAPTPRSSGPPAKHFIVPPPPPPPLPIVRQSPPSPPRSPSSVLSSQPRRYHHSVPQPTAIAHTSPRLRLPPTPPTHTGHQGHRRGLPPERLRAAGRRDGRDAGLLLPRRCVRPPKAGVAEKARQGSEQAGGAAAACTYLLPWPSTRPLPPCLRSLPQSTTWPALRWAT